MRWSATSPFHAEPEQARLASGRRDWFKRTSVTGADPGANSLGWMGFAWAARGNPLAAMMVAIRHGRVSLIMV